MDWQKVIENAVQVKRAAEMKTSEQVTLGELILKLEAIEDKSKPVIFDDRYFPVDIDSWRGSYYELALEYAEVNNDPLDTAEQARTVDTWLKRLKAAIGETFGGYKGGEFVMGKTTPIWVARYGDSCGFSGESQAVVDVSQTEQVVILVTQDIEY